MPTAVHAEPPLSQASPCKAPSPATSGTGCRVHAAPFHVVVPGHGAPAPSASGTVMPLADSAKAVTSRQYRPAPSGSRLPSHLFAVTSAAARQLPRFQAMLKRSPLLASGDAVARR